MSLIEEWRGMAETEMTPKERKAFWDEYYGLEKEAYKIILERKENYLSGALSALAAEFGMSSCRFCRIYGRHQFKPC